MNIHIKRILCLVLVVCLLLTLPGCTSAGDLVGALWHLARRLTYLLSYAVIIPAMWVVDQVTWPFVEYTGFNVNDLGNRICQTWTELILPEGLMDNGWWGGWFVIRDEEELEARLREGGHWPQETLGVLDGQVAEGMVPTKPAEPSGAEEPTESAGAEAPTEKEEISGMEDAFADPTLPTETFHSEGEGQVDQGPGIHYDANGGQYAPEDQPVSSDSQKGIYVTEEVPIRAGYHFMGWTDEYDPEKVVEVLNTGIMQDCNPVQYQPGDRIDGEYERIITEGITLYAVWNERALYEENHMPQPYTHRFTVRQEKSGRNPTPYVTITCSCGMTVTDRDLLEIDFLIYCRNMDQSMSISDANRLYRLYLGQDIGPLALQFNTMAYDENILFEQADLAFVEINTGKVKTEPDFTKFFAELSGHAKKLKRVAPTVEKYFIKVHSGKMDRKELEQMFKEVAMGKKLDAAGKAFGLFRLLAASEKMLDADKDIFARTVGMLEVVEAVASFTAFGKAVGDVSEVLQEGLKLVEKCEKTRADYQDALMLAAAEGNSELGRPTITAWLEAVMGDSRIAQAHQELVLTGTPGCTCGTSTTCNFDAQGMALRHFPDVATVIWRMENASGEPTALEKNFLSLYLAERSRHELYKRTGLTLKEYADLLS